MSRENVVMSLYEFLIPDSESERRVHAEYVIREFVALQARDEKAEAMVERMIQAGNRLYELAEELDDLVDEFRAYPDLVSWRTLVAEWKERERLEGEGAMKQISEYADNMIDNIMLTAWERGAYADQVTGYDEAEALYYQKQESNELKAYIAELEAEVEALRPYRDGYDPKERLPEVNKYEPDTSVNVDALILTASGVVFWGTPYYHFGKKEWLGIRDNMVILRWYPQLPYSESEVRNE